VGSLSGGRCRGARPASSTVSWRASTPTESCHFFVVVVVCVCFVRLLQNELEKRTHTQKNKKNQKTKKPKTQQQPPNKQTNNDKVQL
jgi:choline-glycine betaine transporter